MTKLTDQQADVLDHAAKCMHKFGSFRPRPDERTCARKLCDKGLLRFVGLDAYGMAEYVLSLEGAAVIAGFAQ